MSLPSKAQLQEHLAVATKFAEDNLKQCCAELVERSETGVLPPGKVRELGVLCTRYAGYGTAVTHAENLIKNVAYKFIAGAK